MLEAKLWEYSVRVNLGEPYMDDNSMGTYLTGHQLDRLFDKLDDLGAIEIDGPGLANRLTVTFPLELNRLAVIRMTKMVRLVTDIVNEVLNDC